MQTLRAMKILILTAEAAPLVKVGGLGDVLGALPAALRAKGHDVRLVLPAYSHVDVLNAEHVANFDLLWDRQPTPVQAHLRSLDGVPVYLLGSAPIAKHPGVYGASIAEDGPKFVFYSLAALELARTIDFQPDVLHVHDSHPGAAVYKLAQARSEGPFWAQTASVVTIHNLPYQNKHAGDALARAGLAPARALAIPHWARDSLMALALAYADEINAVSPGYAREITTEEYGAGLHELLKTRADHLRGILNGLDYNSWNPATDAVLRAPYDATRLPARVVNKADLQTQLGLAQRDAPLLGVVSRLDHQKGIDLLPSALEPMLASGEIQLAVLGAGAADIEADLRRLQDRHPAAIALRFQFDAALARQIYAGVDVFLMPSRYEPCGLGQMIAMRYGAVPIVRATGGLADTVVDYDVRRRRSTGFVFEEYSGRALRAALQRAMIVFADRRRWRSLMRRGMAMRFSWERSATAYEIMYAEALGATASE
ncbi:MAG: glycogen synthase [Anaerolineales bacterium]